MAQDLIQTLRTEMAKFTGIDPCGPSYKMLTSILDGCNDDALKQVHVANIKFVSPLAFNRMIRRGLI
jgi:lipoate-protein ligase B